MSCTFNLKFALHRVFFILQLVIFQQEQLRGQRSYDNVGTGGEYNQPARSFSHSRGGGGGQGYYQNDRQNSRKLLSQNYIILKQFYFFILIHLFHA